ncbi:MAG: hypothetical protein ACU0DK_12615 [Pseudooceanicola sp.]
MTRQNRVLPTGEIVADPVRGTLTGNRGILEFDAAGQLGTPRWRSKAWICCTLHHPRGKYQGPAPANSWTPLFFLDEAVALAAGHRPCAYCRRAAYDAFRAAWAKGIGDPGRATAIDAILHAARVTHERRQVRFRAEAATLPPGTFIHWNGGQHLVTSDVVLPFSPAGYTRPLTRPDAMVTVLTPAPTLAVLAAGYAPELHQSATA